MPFGTSIMNYAANMKGAASWGLAAAGTRMGRVGLLSAAGAMAGGAYGATIGRDYGQSGLGGFATGALGGAALGRYGGAGALALGRRMGTRAQMNMAASGWLGFGRVGAGMAGRAAFRQMSRDAMMTRRYIGMGINKAANSFRALRR